MRSALEVLDSEASFTFCSLPFMNYVLPQLGRYLTSKSGSGVLLNLFYKPLSKFRCEKGRTSITQFVDLWTGNFALVSNVAQINLEACTYVSFICK